MNWRRYWRWRLGVAHGIRWSWVKYSDSSHTYINSRTKVIKSLSNLSSTTWWFPFLSLLSDHLVVSNTLSSLYSWFLSAMSPTWRRLIQRWINGRLPKQHSQPPPIARLVLLGTKKAISGLSFNNNIRTGDCALPMRCWFLDTPAYH